MAPIKHFPAPSGVKAPPLSFAARTGDLLFISGIPGFDENRALPDSFEAQFKNVVINIKPVGWVEPLRNPSQVAIASMGFLRVPHLATRDTPQVKKLRTADTRVGS